MSSSKGRGSSAKEISDLVPAKILRLALLGKDPMHAFSFDPEGDTIPVLYDLYDKLAEYYAALALSESGGTPVAPLPSISPDNFNMTRLYLHSPI